MMFVRAHGCFLADRLCTNHRFFLGEHATPDISTSKLPAGQMGRPASSNAVNEAFNTTPMRSSDRSSQQLGKKTRWM